MSPVSSKHTGSFSDLEFPSSDPEPVQKQKKESGKPVHGLLFPKDEYLEALEAKMLFRGVKHVFPEKNCKVLDKLRGKMNEKEI